MSRGCLILVAIFYGFLMVFMWALGRVSRSDHDDDGFEDYRRKQRRDRQ